MDRDPRAAEASRGDAGFGDLLSVDADAHLQKLAACMFPTPAQLPVELVRSALSRGAAAVVVEIGRRRLLVDDDGAGIAGGQWLDLACALDSGRDAAERERAIAALQAAARPGIGLLAVFVPGAEEITIENASGNDRMAMRLWRGRVTLAASGAKPRGTRITVARRRAPVAVEIRLLKELCSAAGAEITLNGRPIEKKPLLRRPLALQQADIGLGGSRASVAVPARGDICRVWLLDQGIPWQLITGAAIHGLVFEAALETAAMPAAQEFDRLAASADRLYHWLAAHYPSFPEKFQERIEELLFRRMRSAGDLQLVSAFAPFRLWRSRQRLNLEEVRRAAARGALYALPLDRDPDLFLDRHQEALRLTPLQKDFLLNHLGLPLLIPAAPMGRQGRMARWLSFAWRKIARVTDRFPRGRIRAVAPEAVLPEEKTLCREMEGLWHRLHGRGLEDAPRFPLTVVMAEGRGLFPAALRQAGGNSVLVVRRRHPLARLAMRSVSADPANVELAFAALAPRPLLTAAGR